VDEQNRRVRFELKSTWDSWNSTLLTNQIYKNIHKEKIFYKRKVRAKIDIESGSIELWISIIDFSYSLAKDIINYIKKRREKKKDLPEVFIKIDDEEREV
jgi:hypothetical protein